MCSGDDKLLSCRLQQVLLPGEGMAAISRPFIGQRGEVGSALRPSPPALPNGGPEKTEP